MKPYGFKIIFPQGVFIRWFSSNGKYEGQLTENVNQVIIAQKFLPFHSAYACSKAACRERGLEFISLTEKDFKKSGSPLKNFFRKLFKRKKC